MTSGEPQRIPFAELPADIPFANNLVRTTYVNPEMHRGFASLSGRVHSASHLDARTRELVALRIAAKLGAAYEWGNHVVGARMNGVSDDEIRAMRDGDVSRLSVREAAAVRFAEAVEDQAVDSTAFAVARVHFDAAELVDLAMLTGFYGLASRFVLAMGVPLDDGLSGLEHP